MTLTDSRVIAITQGVTPGAQVFALQNTVPMQSVVIENYSSLVVNIFAGGAPSGTPRFVVQPYQQKTLPLSGLTIGCVAFEGVPAADGYCTLAWSDSVLAPSAFAIGASDIGPALPQSVAIVSQADSFYVTPTDAEQYSHLILPLAMNQGFYVSSIFTRGFDRQRTRWQFSGLGSSVEFTARGDVDTRFPTPWIAAANFEGGPSGPFQTGFNCLLNDGAPFSDFTVDIFVCGYIAPLYPQIT